MRNIVFIVLCACVMSASAQVVTLDSCRHMALNNNKEIKQASLDIEKAGYQRKEAAAAYLPQFDLTAGYIYNSRKVSLVKEDQMLPTKSFNLQTGTYEYNLVIDPRTGAPLQLENGQYVPSTVALLPKSGLTYNIHNLMGGALTVTQPIYMGGKITATNEMTALAEQLAQEMRDSKVEDVLYHVDAAYWQVVSLCAKQKLARSYVDLVQKLDDDVKAMVNEGVATRANQLAVDVKLNEANVDLTKVDNGVTLSRMLLAQLCGLPVNTMMTLADENRDDLDLTLAPSAFNLDEVYGKRHDVRSLELATKIYDQKVKVARSEMMPQLAAVAALHATNPNSYDGFENKFGAAFSVGAMLKVPLWHWGGLSNKVKAAQVEANVKRLELDDAKEKIALQISQAAFSYQEAFKTYEATKANLDQANENLRIAGIAFKEGMGTVDEILAAQTAWLKANSEKIDAEINVQLCHVNLNKVMGNMAY
ncbi:MAG: TolC family protein [Muribaculaceae bacterium]|nr:TolC family protein [Muribaculaceae bacterium]